MSKTRIPVDWSAGETTVDKAMKSERRKNGKLLKAGVVLFLAIADQGSPATAQSKGTFTEHDPAAVRPKVRCRVARSIGRHADRRAPATCLM